MSTFSDALESHKLPQSSRFFNQTTLPDLRTFQLVKNGRQVAFNGQQSNINYNPYNFSQSKTKANFPLDFFHLPNKIFLTDLPNNSDNEEPTAIPCYKLDDNQAKDPIRFVDSVHEEAKRAGAIKVKIPVVQDNLLRSNFQINSDLFWFQSNKLLYNSPRDEIKNRLKFHTELIKFHIKHEKSLNQDSTDLNDIETDDKSIEKTDSEKPVTENEKPPSSISNILNTPAISSSEKSNASLPVDGTPADSQLAQDPESTQTVPKVKKEPDQELKNEGKGENPEMKEKRVPSFLVKLPMIDKRPVDLYKLFRAVVIRGGFVEVINKKLWAQIGRELGYKGKIMTSLSSSLKSSYQRILYPFELELGQKSMQMFGTEPNSGEISENGQDNFAKRPSDFEESPRKRHSSSPLIVGSASHFSRSVQAKGAKGILANTPHLIDIKPPISFAARLDDSNKKVKKSSEIIESPILPQNQLNHALSYMLTSPSSHNSYQDDNGLKSVPKIASIYTMRQFMEKDLKFQEFIIQHNAQYFNKVSSNYPSFFHFNEANMPIPERNFIKFEKYEDLYWKFVFNDSSHSLLSGGLELEHGENLLGLVHGSGFARIGDDLTNYKNNLNNLTINASPTKIFNMPEPAIPSNGDAQVTSPVKDPPVVNSISPNPPNDVDSFNTDYYISNILQSAMNPWNFHNLPVLPNSLFGALSETDLSNQDLTNTRINIGMTFSTQNWKCEDHFTQLINYQFFGACKKWYFVPESEFEKFESLIVEVNEANKDRMSINNDNWDIEELIKLMEFDDPDATEGEIGTKDAMISTLSGIGGLEYDTLVNSLENMILPFQEQRLAHLNPSFQKLIDIRKNKTRYNQDFLITPAMLTERGIRYTTTIQRPGEFIIKPPKTYSMTLSFGLNFSEEVNFASQVWLPYALQGEKWLSKQNILPNFSTFKLLVNLIQLYDSGRSIGFNSSVHRKVGEIYDEMYKREIQLRDQVRSLNVTKETAIESAVNGVVNDFNNEDFVSDDELANTFPSKIVLTDKATNQSFILSLESFLDHYEKKALDFEKYKVELQVMYSDEKLKTFSKMLAAYSIDYKQWTQKYEELMISNAEITLKVYKSLLVEGERIFSAISSANFVLGGTGSSATEEDRKVKMIELNKFKGYIENLRFFISDCNQFIEDCQNLLAIKHQQRIRSGNDTQKSQGIKELVRLVDRIPTLNFSCPEIDQILEFKAEIENFDKATRVLLSKKSRPIKELDDLIDLGESFGIEIPSLTFLSRVRDRLKWIELYKLIVNGDDPFSDKKEVFTLDNLRDYFNQGLQILGENDIEMIKSIENILNQSEEFNEEISQFLKYESADEIDMDEVNRYVNRFSAGKLFLSGVNYEELSRVHLNSKLIKDLKEYLAGVKSEENKQQFSYSDIRQLQVSLNESGLRANIGELVAHLFKAEEWAFICWDEFRDKEPTTTITKDTSRKDLNPKLTLNARLLEKLILFGTKAEFSFSSEDSYEISSSYLLKFAKHKEGEEEASPKFYCNCREYEFGTMIECDRCNEWYHIVCVDEKEDQGEDDNYTCPVCRLLDSNEMVDDYIKSQITLERLHGMLEDGRNLKVYCANELSVLEQTCNELDKHHESIEQDISNLRNGSHSVEYKVDKYRFYLRKVYGSGIIMTDLLDVLVKTLREEEAKLPKPIQPEPASEIKPETAPGVSFTNVESTSEAPFAASGPVGQSIEAELHQKLVQNGTDSVPESTKKSPIAEVAPESTAEEGPIVELAPEAVFALEAAAFGLESNNVPNVESSLNNATEDSNNGLQSNQDSNNIAIMREATGKLTDIPANEVSEVPKVSREPVSNDTLSHNGSIKKEYSLPIPEADIEESTTVTSMPEAIPSVETKVNGQANGTSGPAQEPQKTVFHQNTVEPK